VKSSKKCPGFALAGEAHLQFQAAKINYSVLNIIDPAKHTQYTDNTYAIRYVVGIGTSDLFIAKPGVQGANDLVIETIVPPQTGLGGTVDERSGEG
jgi:hypothetical protein